MSRRRRPGAHPRGDGQRPARPPARIRERGTCVSAIGGSVAVIAAVTRSSNFSELTSSRHSGSWYPRTSRRRPGQALTRATKSSSSNASPCATSPRHMIRSVGATLLVQARRMRSASALGRRWRSDQIQVSLAGVSTVRTGSPCVSSASSYSVPVTPPTRAGSGIAPRAPPRGWRRRRQGDADRHGLVGRGDLEPSPGRGGDRRSRDTTRRP